MTRRYGRAQKGTRVHDEVPFGRWETTTLVGAMTMERAVAPMVLDGAMDTLAFEAYVEQVLIPALEPGAIVVMDNLSAHKSVAISRMLKQADIGLCYLPPYSPDYNPIEQMWSKVKTLLRGAKARDEQSLDQAIAEALRQVTAQDTQGFFRHCFVAIIS